ncbi:hypothetical protein OEZ49_01785 [Ruegeria sp. WL0004]|uniref:Transposase n=1 Tax=Ruegeria marisflavi TaxID=2984152 RepID=A0ABT2WQS8_9RHOB|nr:hypothetical protein [Ruegeria sp. WL0004]MCU9836488.1 hypothetical protein [Ruegeria sp. WL0004]
MSRLNRILEWFIQRYTRSPKFENPYPELTAETHMDQENGQMFERHHFRTNQDITSEYGHGRVALGRHEIRKERYLAERRARLEAEANARKDQFAAAPKEAVEIAICHLLRSVSRWFAQRFSTDGAL